ARPGPGADGLRRDLVLSVEPSFRDAACRPAAPRGAIGFLVAPGERAMKFAGVIEYTDDKAKIQEVRPAHRQYLSGLKANGQLVVAGPFPDDSGGLIVYEAASREEAEALVQGDPFFQNGVFVSYVLRPWNPVMANRDLLPAT